MAKMRRVQRVQEVVFRPYSGASSVQLMQDQANYPCRDVLRSHYRRKRPADGVRDVLETCMGEGGIIRVRCERMRGISGLAGSVGAVAGSSAGTAG